jgi:hypothetical protein
VRRDGEPVAEAHAAVTEPDATPPPGPKGWRRHYTRTRAIVAAASAAALGAFALLEGSLDLVDRFRDEPCAEVQAGTLGEPRLDASVTRGQSLELSGSSTDGLTAERLAEPGKMIALSLTAKGYRGEPLRVWARVLTQDGAPVDELELPDLLVSEWTPDKCDDSNEAQAWSPVPRTPGSYLIQISLRTKDREGLDSARTPVFEVPASGP